MTQPKTDPIAQKRTEPVPEAMTKLGIWVFESRHDENFAMSSTRHTFPKLLYFREGSGKIWYQNGSEPKSIAVNCNPGDCVFMASGTPHRIIDAPKDPISLFGLAIDPRQFPPCEDLDMIIPNGALPRHRVSLLRIEHRIRRLLYLITKRDTGSRLSTIAGAIETFAQIAMVTGSTASATSAGNDGSLAENPESFFPGPSISGGAISDTLFSTSPNSGDLTADVSSSNPNAVSTRDEPLDRRGDRGGRGDRDRVLGDAAAMANDVIGEYIQWLDSNFFESLTVDDAASACEMSRRKFTHDFRQRTGMTWLEYLNRRRIEHAVQRLAQTDQKVTSIAFQSGFEELSTFYRTFKRVTGRKPTDFRSPPDPSPRRPGSDDRQSAG